MKPWLAVGAFAAGGLGTGMLLQPNVQASGDVAPPAFSWSHNGILSSLDHARLVRISVLRYLQYIQHKEL